MARRKYNNRQRRRIAKAFRQAKVSMESTAAMYGTAISVNTALYAAAKDSRVAQLEAAQIVHDRLFPYMWEHEWLKKAGARYITARKLHQWRLAWLDKLIKEFS